MAPWRRTYWVVWTANLVTAIGMMSFLPFFPSYISGLGVEDIDEVALWTGLVFGAAPLAASFMTPIWGALGDRYGRRLMTVRAMLAITVFVGCMSLATEPWHLLALRIGQGCFSGFVAPSITLVSVIAPRERQGEVAGSLQTALALGAVIGPLLGGILGPELGLRTLFLGVAIASLVSAALVWFQAREDKSHRLVMAAGTTPLEILRGSIQDLREVWRRPAMNDALKLVFWMILGVGATNPLLELFVDDVGGGEWETERVTGLLVSVMAAVTLIAMPIWGRYGDRRGHAKALRLCALFSVFALWFHALVPGLVTLFIARILLGAAMAGSTPLAYGLAANQIGIERRGGAMGAVFSARTFAIAASAMFGGLASRWLGVRGLFVLGGVLLLMALLLTRLPRRPASDTLH